MLNITDFFVVFAWFLIMIIGFMAYDIGVPIGMWLFYFMYVGIATALSGYILGQKLSPDGGCC